MADAARTQARGRGRAERSPVTPLSHSLQTRTTNIVFLLDDEGHVQTRLQGPAGTEASLTAVSPDGSRVAVIWMGPKDRVFTLYDPDSGKPTATSAQTFGYDLGTWSSAPTGRASPPPARMG